MSLQDVIETAVAVGTFALAFVTWRMAVATRRVAEDSEAQLALLRRSVEAAEQANLIHERQTIAAEKAAEATERQAAGTARPKLIVEREQGKLATASTEPPNAWLVFVRNVGQAEATVEEAKVNLAPQPLNLDLSYGMSVPPGERRALRGETSPQILDEGMAGTLPFPLSVTYSGPNGDRWNMQATLRGDGNDRWSMMEAERHKSAGPAPRASAPR